MVGPLSRRLLLSKAVAYTQAKEAIAAAEKTAKELIEKIKDILRPPPGTVLIGPNTGFGAPNVPTKPSDYIPSTKPNDYTPSTKPSDYIPPKPSDRTPPPIGPIPSIKF